MPPVREVNPLQRLINGWLAEAMADLPELPAITIGPLLTLSPLKRDKAGQSAGVDRTHIEKAVARDLLGLLAGKILETCLDSYEPGRFYPLYCLEQPPLPDTPARRKIKADIDQLDPAILSAGNLAALHLSDTLISDRTQRRNRKRTGSYYTPATLASYITRQAQQLGHEPFPLVDPACGGGVFLLAALEQTAANDPVTAVAGKIYGLDLNPDAADLARLAVLCHLREQYGPLPEEIIFILARQIRAGNALLSGKPTGEMVEIPEGGRKGYTGWLAQFQTRQQALTAELAALPIFDHPGDGPYLAGLAPFDWRAAWPEIAAAGGFNVVVGNPPYVGFNDYSGVEKAYFARAFPEVYNLKADLLYYFICQGVRLLREDGALGFVTSRFWKEAAFAARLREWLATATTLAAIEDQGQDQLFADALVDSCLLFLRRQTPALDTQLAISYPGHRQQIRQSELGKAPWGWLRRPVAGESLLEKLEATCVRLGEVAECRTGVQSGLDEVFFVDAKIAGQLEPEVIRLALKSAQIIAPGEIRHGNLYLIYPRSDLALEDFSKLAAYLEPHRARLERRRRYRKPFPHYELQWPRLPALFDTPAKLVTPYKAPRNWFALDTCRYFFSTDVVSVVFREELSEELLRAALAFLNSDLSTWQFRSYSKQVGGGQYDYYANPLKNLLLPNLHDLVRLSGQLETNKKQDEAVFALLDLTGAEIDLVRRGLDKPVNL